MKRKQLYILLSLILLVAGTHLLLVSCARMGTPDGGLYDETPPVLVRTSPANGKVKTSPKKIVLEFDEIVKLDNAQAVVVSPPQLEAPEIEAYGRKVTITLIDTIKPNMTYTIDFGNSISDNNEGNPFGDFAFTFSTGEKIDTFQVSGYVLEASNLEPIKDILVGLYKMDDADSETQVSDTKGCPDSVFYKKPFERISHTDSRGHFVIKGLDPDASYKVFALKDQDQDYRYSQASEMLAFTDRIIKSSCKPDLRPDTIWHDSIHYEDIKYIPYTHFYPDDITLLAFNEDRPVRHKLKEERPELHFFTLYFTAPDDTLPLIKGLNFDEKDAFVVAANERKDTITYWIKDSLIYNLDTLEMALQYHDTDTLGALVLYNDTLRLTSKVSYARTQKLKADKQANWEKDYLKDHKAEAKAKKKEGESLDIPPMPEEFMEVNTNSTNNLDPENNMVINFTSPEPLDTVDISKFHLGVKVDSLTHPVPFTLVPDETDILTYHFKADWKCDSAYVLQVDTGALVSIYGKRIEGSKRNIKIKSAEAYALLNINVNNADTSAIVELLSAQDKAVRTQKVVNGKVKFTYLQPSTYYLRLFYDHNGNGKWDSGDYSTGTQPEEVYYLNKAISVKANWDYDENWAPTSLPVFEQKPARITKQKPDKEKVKKGRNAEKLAEMERRKKRK